MPDAPELTLEAFLRDADQFRLGQLPTEQPHPKTKQLAAWSRQDVPGAVAALREVDLDALAVLRDRAGDIERLSQAIGDALRCGGRIYLCGCGATGRLALSLETLWRQMHRGHEQANSVLSLMAGGDTALISSIEGFEDHPDLGARHLDELGFDGNDLLISCTEGGETAWVLGATERAADVSDRQPWLLYCNPDQALRGIERSERAIDDPRIVCLSIPTGPMALSGSTRMQASTVLMLAVGLALLQPDNDPATRLDLLGWRVSGVNDDALTALVEAESAAYQSGEYVLYAAERHAITVLTDTTERSPTFNLASFENQLDDAPEPSLCYLTIESAANATAGWLSLLWRKPRPLDWEGFEALAGSKRLFGFDFSRRIADLRRARLNGAVHRRFGVTPREGSIELDLCDQTLSLDVSGLSLLEEHVLLKLVLNAHSTLVMGRLGRYESNVMTWVRPSNRKLIDRTIRYVDSLWRRRAGNVLSYEQLARAVFATIDELDSEHSIVLETVKRLERELAG